MHLRFPLLAASLSVAASFGIVAPRIATTHPRLSTPCRAAAAPQASLLRLGFQTVTELRAARAAVAQPTGLAALLASVKAFLIQFELELIVVSVVVLLFKLLQKRKAKKAAEEAAKKAAEPTVGAIFDFLGAVGGAALDVTGSVVAAAVGEAPKKETAVAEKEEEVAEEEAGEDEEYEYVTVYEEVEVEEGAEGEAVAEEKPKPKPKSGSAAAKPRPKFVSDKKPKTLLEMMQVSSNRGKGNKR